MPIFEIASTWIDTGIPCPKCGYPTYTNGKQQPQCAECLEDLPNEFIWEWLITRPECRVELYRPEIREEVELTLQSEE
jgi:hypothetical protein